jgi:glycosyltransferase involved in cell wall biosynthesis
MPPGRRRRGDAVIKVAYVYHLDAANPTVQSGRPASILRHMTLLGASVHPVFPMATQFSRLSTVKKALYRLAGRYYRGDREPRYLSAMAAEFTRRTRGMDYDIVFCPGSEVISHLDITRPIAFCADATFANMIDYYWDFSSLSSDYVRKGHLQEANALRRASLAIYPSDWAARSAINFYHTDPNKVAIIPFGANFGAENRRDQVHQWIAGRRFDSLRLLFVGRSWRRKGGDLVVETAQRLVQKGLRVTLDIVSDDVPRSLDRIPWITHHGFLDPGRPGTAEALGSLFRSTHFFFMPSRAEAYGMAFAEANAFGVPTIGTATGGIPSIIKDGVNGYTLPLTAGAADFADLIAGSINQRDRYQSLCRSSFGEFEKRLNWRAFCTRFLDLASRCRDDSAQTPGALRGQTTWNLPA